MKIMINRNIRVLLFIYTIFTFSVNCGKASHLFGGEITWKCIGSGQYQFQLKIYRDCNGIPVVPVNQIDVYGHPTVCSIPINAALTVINDISPQNCTNNCNTGGAGTVQEHIFTSNPISLPGIPPVTGWTFVYHSAARNVLENLNGGGQGFSLRSTMYAYNGINTNPCFDSSPYFAERPNVYTCIGYPYTYNPNAIDMDGDSLAYSWADCLEEPTGPTCTPFSAAIIPFGPTPYTLQNQLPGNCSLNTANGAINFYVTNAAATIGNFASCVKVTSYRNGIKISEIYRDCGFTLVNNCLVQGTAPNNTNNAPIVIPIFNLGTTNDTSIVACDTIRFRLNAADFQQNIGGTGQTVTLTASGFQLANPTNTSGGCNNPPCAQLSKYLPFTAPIATFVDFTWATEADLLDSVPVCHGTQSKSYYFVIKANDNYCPAPAYTFSTIGITLTRPPVFLLNNTVWVSSHNALSYQWYFNCVPIPGATDSLYNFTASGSYECLIQTKNGCPLFSQYKQVNFVGINSMDALTSVSVVPNPANEKFTLSIEISVAKITDIVFSDVTGRILMSEKLKLKTGNNSFEYSSLKFSPGTYFVKVGSGTGAVTRKIVVR